MRLGENRAWGRSGRDRSGAGPGPLSGTQRMGDGDGYAQGPASGKVVTPRPSGTLAGRCGGGGGRPVARSLARCVCGGPSGTWLLLAAVAAVVAVLLPARCSVGCKAPVALFRSTGGDLAPPSELAAPGRLAGPVCRPAPVTG